VTVAADARPQLAPLRLSHGEPHPLGATWLPEIDADQVNFAVWAPEASSVELCLFDPRGEVELQRLALPACSDGVWHGCLHTAPEQAARLVYGLRAHGRWAPHEGLRFNPAKLLLDPWAREVVGRYAGQPAELAQFHGHDSRTPDLPDGHDTGRRAVKARVVATPAAPARPLRLTPGVPRDRTVIYELHVKGATELHPDLPAALRGRYLGLAHPALLAHYRRLGVTSLCLLPVHARADEARLQQLGLVNFWGYNSLAWLAPEPRYASRPEAARDEFAAMVAGLHGAGLEVLLDVVYNHTAEGDARGPTLSLRGLANRQAYRLEAGDRARYVDWAGCGNTVNLAEPRVIELVLGSLRHWVTSYGVDGFRFDLASILGRGGDGHFAAASGFFAALRADPVLGGVKLIAEPWDVAPGGYQLGGYPPGWSEWNDQFRDTLRAWWLGRSPATPGASDGRPQAPDRGVFAHRFAGSSAQFHHSGRLPSASIHYITAHDGYTLRDTLSYQQRHNLANGEDNRDGHPSNHSWNCGVEGASDDPAVGQRRARLQRALLASLLLAQGTPMLLGGDELGHSQGGNNNAYCQDNHLTWLNWSQAEPALVDCISRLLALRQRHAALRPLRWLSGRPDAAGWRDVVWLHPDGHELHGSDWADSADRAMALRLVAPVGLAEPARTPSASALPLSPSLSPQSLQARPGLQSAGPASPADAAQPQMPMALLITLNPLDHPRRFVLPAGDWRAEFCTTAADGVPAATGADSAVDGDEVVDAQAHAQTEADDLPGSQTRAAPRRTTLPAHTLRVYVAALTSLGPPDAVPLEAPDPAPSQAIAARSGVALPVPVDRRGEP
jgi:glycogen operon protein